MTFGLISEGITDHLVISTIIKTLLNHEEQKANTSQLCPMQDEPSGWTKVFSYISCNDFKEFLLAKDAYVVIHLDTDTRGDWSGYFKDNVAALELLKSIPVISGSDKNKVAEIVDNIVTLIRLVIGSDFYDANKDRIIPAIAVNEMECWVLPFHAESPSDKEKMVNCLKTLNEYLKKDGYSIAADAKATGNYKYYLKAIKDMTKRKTLMEKYELNGSLKIFVDKLQQIS